MLVVRQAEREDFNQDFIDTLESLSEVNLSKEQFQHIALVRSAFCRDWHPTYVALLGRKVVGTASIIWERKFIHSGGLVGHIEDVAVHRDYQKKGIGKALIAALVERARALGCYKLLLYCDEELQEYYQKLGFYRRASQMRIDFNPEPKN